MDPIEQKIIQLIEEHREDIIQIGRSIWEYPELGYKEFRTSKLFTEFMEKFGLPVERGLAITGAKAYLKDRNMDGRWRFTGGRNRSGDMTAMVTVR